MIKPATATMTHTAFRQQCSVRCDIAATSVRIWTLLTTAADFPRWNSTVTSVKGAIELGQRLELRVPLDPKRTFKPVVTELDATGPRRSMVWSDGFAPVFRGVRRFTVEEGAGDGGTSRFEMTEVFSGVMFPLIRGSLPDFRPAFEAYAADLKRAAERAG